MKTHSIDVHQKPWIARVGQFFSTPGHGGWSFLAGMGSTVLLVPGVHNPGYQTYAAEWITPEEADFIAIHGDWEIVGHDLSEAIEQTAKVA